MQYAGGIAEERAQCGTGVLARPGGLSPAAVLGIAKGYADV
jgi:hypothetical protein